MSKIKGCRTERELLHLFWDAGFVCSRMAGSGSIPLPSPDLIAGKDGRILVIECKSGKSQRYLTKKEVDELRDFGVRMGAEAWIALRFNNQDWYFMETEKLKQSRGGNFFADIKLAKEKGILFKDLIAGV